MVRSSVLREDLGPRTRESVDTARRRQEEIDRQRIGLDALLQNAVDGRVAGLVETEGSTTGQFQPARSVFVRQAEHGLNGAQSIQRTFPEQASDQLVGGRTDARRLLPTEPRCREQPGNLLRRVVILDRSPGARRTPAVAGEPFVLVKDVHVAAVGPDPQPLTDEPMRCGVKGAVVDDMAVRMKLGLLPHAEIEGIGRQRLKCGLLHLEEAGQRSLLGCSVDADTGDFLDPLQELRVGLGHVAKGPARQEIALYVMNSRLDLPFVPWRFGSTGRDEESVVFRALAVVALGHGIVEHGLDDRGLEVVQNNLGRNPAEVLESFPVAAQPSLDLLVEDQDGILVAAVRKGHDEDPGPAHFARARIHHLPGGTKVDLGFGAGFDFDADEPFGKLALQVDHESAQRRVAALIAVLRVQPLEEGRHLHLLLPQLFDDRPEPLRLEDLTGLVFLGQPCCEKTVQVLRRRQRAFQKSFGCGDDPVTSHRFAGGPEVPGNGPVALTGPKPANYFSNIECHESPSCHVMPSLALWLEPRRYPLWQEGSCPAPSALPLVRASKIRDEWIREESPRTIHRGVPSGSRTANMVVPYEANTGGTLSANMVATMGRTVTFGAVFT
jgi:hypothetical protein